MAKHPGSHRPSKSKALSPSKARKILKDGKEV